MLSKDDNALLTKTGPGTPMGEVFRRYWLPAMLSEELPSPDCTPVKLRLLGEDLVVFRDTSGRVGVIDQYCPHRNANLFWGRNEEDGLRCVYHGWKFDVEGICVDMPNEPASSVFANKVRINTYSGIDRGGLIWVYMGDRDKTPAVPDLEFNYVPESHRLVTKRLQHCNYLQNLEGEVDSSHVSFLHSRGGAGGVGAAFGDGAGLNDFDRAPLFEFKETDYGLAISARRDAPENKYYWRVTQFLMPTYTMIPSTPGGSVSFTAAIPVDDYEMIGITVTWHPDHPLEQDEIDRIRSWTGVHTEVDAKFEPLRHKGNSYFIDREAQSRGESFTGIRGIREQDLAVQEDQRGPLSAREREHLGTADLGVISTRRRLQRQVRDLINGIEPLEPNRPEAYRVRSAAFTDEPTADWQTAGAAFMKANPPRDEVKVAT